MKIIVKELPKATNRSIVDKYVIEYSQSGRDVKTEEKDDKIVLYFIQDVH